MRSRVVHLPKTRLRTDAQTPVLEQGDSPDEVLDVHVFLVEGPFDIVGSPNVSYVLICFIINRLGVS
jgi:hypothetical protein